MKFPQKILVVVSGKRREHIALARALQLAEFYDIKLHLLSCVYDPGTEISPLISNDHKNAIKSKKLQNRLDYLNEIKTALKDKQVPIETHVIWHRKVQNAVIEMNEELKPDLIIKRISENASSVNPFTMPMDWQLLRLCPAPLLLVKDAKWKITSPIIASVDVNSDSDKRFEFNHTIINYAKLFSRLTDSETHVVTTHITPNLDNATTIPGFDLQELKEKVMNLNKTKLKELVSNYNIDDKNLHVVEGLTEVRVPALAKQLDSQIVVMGTIGRSGIKGAFMGNTAEKVLTYLQCEVLALKPS